MWTLLLWLNQKIEKGYLWLAKGYKAHKIKSEVRKQMRIAKQLPDYLRRDMGLPPYNEQSEER